MLCNNPIRIPVLLGTGYESKAYPNGLIVPCGKCISCRIKKRCEWSLRMTHELDSHNNSIFVTLTYDENNIPEHKSLKKQDFVKFLKRLRKNLNHKIKYFACGEYGDQTERPHYHAIIFGLSLREEDKEKIKAAWPLGRVHFGLAEKDSINYVAKYIDKQYSGDLAEKEFTLKNREPVFRLLSNGLGQKYALKHAEQIIQNQKCTLNGKPQSIPRYYLKLLNITPDQMEEIKQRAIQKNCELTEHITGINIDSEKLYKHSSTLFKQYYEQLQQIRKNHNKHLSARVELYSKKI